ncbi:MAG: O-antigen ligase family protein [Acidobacteria bacterium]|nr:O-antigen ligase family protein [Acidobacteriota bacterium]
MIAEARTILAGLSPAVRTALAFYLIHLFFQPKIAASQIATGFALLAFGYALAKREIGLAWSPLYPALIVYVAGSLVAALVAPDPLASLLELGEPLAFVTLPLAASLYAREPRLVSWGFGVLCAMAAFRSVQGVVQYATAGHAGLEHRITGGTTHVMTFSGILLPIALATLVLAIDRRRWWHIAMALVTVGALALTLTRSAWLGYAAGAAAIVLVRRAKWVPLIAAVALLVIVLAPMPFFSRLVSSFDPQKSSNLDRLRMAQAGVEIIADHPLFGIGPGNIKETYPLYRLPDAPRFRIPHLHNNPLQIWAERGVVPLFGWLLLIGLAVRQGWRQLGEGGERSSWGLAGLVATVGLAIAGLFEFNFGDAEVTMNWLDLLAVAFATALPERAAIEQPGIGN